MNNKNFTNRQVEIEVKKATAFQALMMALGSKTDDLDYITMIELLADAQNLILSLQNSDECAKDFNYSSLAFYLDQTHDLLKLLKPLSEIANLQ